MLFASFLFSHVAFHSSPSLPRHRTFLSHAPSTTSFGLRANPFLESFLQFPLRGLFWFPLLFLSFLTSRPDFENPSFFLHSRQVPSTFFVLDFLPNLGATNRSSPNNSTMAQAREAAFNPSSPHSSSGGADSYKHDGTPDTRLTAFSPEESSARSSKLLKALNLSTPNDQQPVRFHVQPNENYCAAPTTEKDPFISSSTTPKTDQKLSPTASSFRPVSSSIPVVAHGSLNGLHKLNTTHLGLNATQKFSNELDVSRYLHVFSPTQAISVSSVDDYIKVRFSMGIQISFIQLTITYRALGESGLPAMESLRSFQ